MASRRQTAIYTKNMQINGQMIIYYHAKRKEEEEEEENTKTHRNRAQT